MQVPFRAAAPLAAGFALLFTGSAMASDGAVYTQTNSPPATPSTGSTVVRTGSLTPVATYRTGGTGTGAGLCSQGAVALSRRRPRRDRRRRRLQRHRVVPRRPPRAPDAGRPPAVGRRHAELGRHRRRQRLRAQRAAARRTSPASTSTAPAGCARAAPSTSRRARRAPRRSPSLPAGASWSSPSAVQPHRDAPAALRPHRRAGRDRLERRRAVRLRLLAAR